MIKKTLIALAVVIGAAVCLFGTDAYSYLTVSARKVRSEVKSGVPIEFEIERARALVADLLPDIRDNMRVIAQEEVEVAELRDQIARAERNLQREKQRILALRADLDNRQGKFRYAGRRATGAEVRAELSRRFERFQTAEATLEANRRMLEAREQTLAAAREKLEGMLAAKRDLEVQLQNFQARYKMLQAMQAASQFQFDDSRLARCKKLMTELRKRLDVAERMLENEGKLVEWITTGPEPPADLTKRIDEYFGADGSEDAQQPSPTAL